MKNECVVLHTVFASIKPIPMDPGPESDMMLQWIPSQIRVRIWNHFWFDSGAEMNRVRAWFLSTNRSAPAPILVRTWARFRSGAGPEPEQIPTRFWPRNESVLRSDAGPEIEQFATRYWYGNVCISEPIPVPKMHSFRIRFRPNTVRVAARFWLGRGPNPCRVLTRQHPNLD